MKRDSSGYPATNMSVQTRDVIAGAAFKLHGLGWSYHSIADLFSGGEFSISPWTVGSYVRHMHRGEAPLKREKKSGAAPLLDIEHREVLAGWFLRRFDDGLKSSPLMYCQAARHLFGVSLSERMRHAILPSLISRSSSWAPEATRVFTRRTSSLPTLWSGCSATTRMGSLLLSRTSCGLLMGSRIRSERSAFGHTGKKIARSENSRHRNW